jgi:predicted permease
VTRRTGWRRLNARLRAWLGRGREDREFAEELDAHVEMLVEDHVRHGLTAEAARREALARIGSRAALLEQHRDVRGLPAIDSVLHDVRDAARGLRRRWAFTLVAITTIGLGIGATTALFSVVYGLLLKPLPFPEQDRLVSLAETREGARQPARPFLTRGTYESWRNGSTMLQDLAGWNVETATVIANHRAPERARIVASTASLFPVLRVRPIRGTLFQIDDEASGGRPVLLLSYEAWRRYYNSADDAVGAIVQIDGRPYTVVGVIGDDVKFPDGDAIGWRPLDRTIVFFDAIGRLRPGVSAHQAADEGTARSRTAPDLGPRGTAMFGSNGPARVNVSPLKGALGAQSRPIILLVFGAGAMLAIVATVNVAGLQLTRTISRRRELAIRSAIGAGRSRVASHLLMEKVMIGVLAGGAGFGLACWLDRLLPVIVPRTVARLEGVTIDPVVMAFNVGLALAVSLACGALSLSTANRIRLVDVLIEDGQSVAPGGMVTSTSRWLWTLMACQIALTAAFLTGTSLISRSFLAVLGTDRGYIPDNLLTARLPLPTPEFPRARRIAILEDVLARVRQVPGVKHAAASDIFPLIDLEFPRALDLPAGQPGGGVTSIRVMSRTVSRDYFATLGMPILRGRGFSDADTFDSLPVAVVNQTFASRYLAGRDPLDAVLPLKWSAGHPDWQVVGVVGDVRQRQATDAPQPEVFACYCQIRERLLAAEPVLALRVDGFSDRYASALTQAVREAAPTAALESLMPMTDRLLDSAAAWRLSLLLVASFCAVAVLLAGVGLFGVLSHSLARRSRELSLRLALGARSADLMRLVLRQVVLVTTVGLIAGVSAAVLIAQVLRTFLFGVAVAGPFTLAAVPVAVLIIAAAAIAIPVTRALRTDPAAALRS